MGKYNVDETIIEGDPLHAEHHVALAGAVNDLDTRVALVEGPTPGSEDYWGRWVGTQDMLPANRLDGVLYVVVETAQFTWLVRDDFTAVEGPPEFTDTGQTYRIESGVWTQANGELYAAADGAIIVVPLGSATQMVEFELSGNLPASGVPTVVLRYDSTNDYHYRLEKYSSTQLRLSRRDPSSTIVWTSNTGVYPGVGAVLRVAVEGQPGALQFRIWVNGVEVTSTLSGSLLDADSTPPMGTEAGFRYGFTSSGNQYRYKKFRASPVIAAP